MSKNTYRKRRSHNIRPALPTNLKELREEKHIDSVDLAAACKIDHRFYIKVEKGEAFPNIYVAMAICNYLEITIDQTFCNYEEWKKDHFKKENGRWAVWNTNLPVSQ